MKHNTDVKLGYAVEYSWKDTETDFNKLEL